MRKMIKMSLVTAMMMGVGAVSAQADGIEFLSNVKAKGLIKSRYEMVDQKNADGTRPGNANAFTNRLTVGASADLFGTDWLSAYVEMTNVSALNDNYNSLTNGQTNHALVADAEQTRVTEAYIDAKFGKSKFRIGRQRINLDNQRMIGSVDWRQMPQTMNALTFMDNSINNLNIFASYITQRNTIFGAGTPVGDKVDTRDVLVNISYKVMDELKVTGYSYMLGSQHDTYGASLTGKIALDGVKLDYRAEYAKQTDASMEKSGGTKPDADADYINLQLNANMSGVLAGVQYEVLSGSNGSDGKTAFKTPYSTLHMHNGWSDVMLPNNGSPLAGLVDANVMLGYASKDLGTFKVIYHDFSSDKGSIDYGTEVDAIYTRAVPGVKGLSGMLKYANYKGKDSVAEGNYAYTAMDREVFWAMATYAFASK